MVVAVRGWPSVSPERGSLETDGGLSTVNTERDESGVRDGPDMNTRISPALLLTALTACQAQHREQQPPYLDSITIQDSCQFSLCGPHYTQEFLQGKYTTHGQIQISPGDFRIYFTLIKIQ